MTEEISQCCAVSLKSLLRQAVKNKKNVLTRTRRDTDTLRQTCVPLVASFPVTFSFPSLSSSFVYIMCSALVSVSPFLPPFFSVREGDMNVLWKGCTFCCCCYILLLFVFIFVVVILFSCCFCFVLLLLLFLLLFVDFLFVCCCLLMLLLLFVVAFFLLFFLLLFFVVVCCCLLCLLLLFFFFFFFGCCLFVVVVVSVSCLLW